MFQVVSVVYVRNTPEMNLGVPVDSSWFLLVSLDKSELWIRCFFSPE